MAEIARSSFYFGIVWDCNCNNSAVGQVDDKKVDTFGLLGDEPYWEVVVLIVPCSFLLLLLLL